MNQNIPTTLDLKGGTGRLFTGRGILDLLKKLALAIDYKQSQAGHVLSASIKQLFQACPGNVGVVDCTVVEESPLSWSKTMSKTNMNILRVKNA